MSDIFNRYGAESRLVQAIGKAGQETVDIFVGYRKRREEAERISQYAEGLAGVSRMSQEYDHRLDTRKWDKVVDGQLQSVMFGEIDELVLQDDHAALFEKIRTHINDTTTNYDAKQQLLNVLKQQEVAHYGQVRNLYDAHRDRFLETQSDKRIREIIGNPDLTPQQQMDGVKIELQRGVDGAFRYANDAAGLEVQYFGEIQYAWAWSNSIEIVRKNDYNLGVGYAWIDENTSYWDKTPQKRHALKETLRKEVAYQLAVRDQANKEHDDAADIVLREQYLKAQDSLEGVTAMIEEGLPAAKFQDDGRRIVWLEELTERKASLLDGIQTERHDVLLDAYNKSAWEGTDPEESKDWGTLSWDEQSSIRTVYNDGLKARQAEVDRRQDEADQKQREAQTESYLAKMQEIEGADEERIRGYDVRDVYAAIDRGEYEQGEGEELAKLISGKQEDLGALGEEAREAGQLHAVDSAILSLKALVGTTDDEAQAQAQLDLVRKDVLALPESERSARFTDLEQVEGEIAGIAEARAEEERLRLEAEQQALFNATTDMLSTAYRDGSLTHSMIDATAVVDGVEVLAEIGKEGSQQYWHDKLDAKPKSAAGFGPNGASDEGLKIVTRARRLATAGKYEEASKLIDDNRGILIGEHLADSILDEFRTERTREFKPIYDIFSRNRSEGAITIIEEAQYGNWVMEYVKSEEAAGRGLSIPDLIEKADELMKPHREAQAQEKVAIEISKALGKGAKDRTEREKTLIDLYDFEGMLPKGGAYTTRWNERKGDTESLDRPEKFLLAQQKGLLCGSCAGGMPKIDNYWHPILWSLSNTYLDDFVSQSGVEKTRIVQAFGDDGMIQYQVDGKKELTFSVNAEETAVRTKTGYAERWMIYVKQKDETWRWEEKKDLRAVFGG